VAEPHYGSYDSQPVRYTGREAWMLVEGEWIKTNLTDVMFGAAGLTEHAYHKLFGALPALPSEAFR
jgi:hypothetical protein